MQREDAVDAPRYRDRPDVAVERHARVPLRAQPVRVGAGARATRRIERRRRTGAVVHEGEQVTAQPAQVRGGHGQDRVGGEGGVDGVAAVREDVDPGGGGEVVDRAHHPARGVAGGGAERAGHGTTVDPRQGGSAPRAYGATVRR
ncbi:hypothetical protein GCM10025864_11400 [Luteimicrobium album]|uniref:Uncharacterized protein n=1 Tax=Luteimicrobium album TaxID=1054550 RepID=A0ABQ6HY03_9MICO|nr:hypothetical protein GCM10025864_11400 [Luteimicrobium album]